jgi:hypothetical protein
MAKATKATKIAAQATSQAQPVVDASAATPATPAVRVVAGTTLVAQARVAAMATRNNGARKLTPNMLRTLQALVKLGALDVASAVEHGDVGRANTVAGVTGRNKGNGLRDLRADNGFPALAMRVDGYGHPRYYATPEGCAASGK